MSDLKHGPAGISQIYRLDPVPEFPEPSFAAGYGMRLMGREDIEIWQRLQKDTEPYFAISDQLFMEQFGHQLDEAWKRCYLITAPDQSAAGTISAWWNEDFEGGGWGQLHWLAVHPEHQGKGLARAACLVVLKRLGREFGRVYLGTQSKRAAAISLYESLGFRLQPE